ncbi:hypothetical protein HanPI659440_Chr10g0384481 [Helianthus annuus]|nr:hypothetical protein HanPI659440_Chr10g0384481 [Helianthus annuus]
MFKTMVSSQINSADTHNLLSGDRSRNSVGLPAVAHSPNVHTHPTQTLTPYALLSLFNTATGEAPVIFSVDVIPANTHITTHPLFVSPINTHHSRAKHLLPHRSMGRREMSKKRGA